MKRVILLETAELPAMPVDESDVKSEEKIRSGCGCTNVLAP